MKLSVISAYRTSVIVFLLASCLLSNSMAGDESVTGKSSALEASEVDNKSALPVEITKESSPQDIHVADGGSVASKRKKSTASVDQHHIPVTNNSNATNTESHQDKVADMGIHTSFDEVALSKSVVDTLNVEEKNFAPPLSAKESNTERLTETGNAVMSTLSAEKTISSDIETSSNLTKSSTSSVGTSFVPTDRTLTKEMVDKDLREQQQSVTELRTDSEEVSKSVESGKEVVDLTQVNAEHTNVSEEHYVVRAEPKILETEKVDAFMENLVENATSHEHKEGISVVQKLEIDDHVKDSAVENASASSVQDSSEDFVSPEDSGASAEDIPSFSEWTQKQLAEAEKKKGQNTTVLNGSARTAASKKLRSKNYASPDCGSKIIGSNPEVVSPGSILSPNRDEYMLNVCTDRIWFVVELCEAIQAKKIELANFELFSSSPREFSVFLSDRYPTRDWRNVGNFVAEDERTVQSFNLEPHLFGKFVKVELVSHYGSEHYCPISLFRVYGTSEFEVLETEDETQEATPDLDDDDEPLDMDTGGGPPKNLFGSARDAVMSIVKKAAEALVKGGESSNMTTPLPIIEAGVDENKPSRTYCVTPSYIIVCDNCSDALFSDVYNVLSCQGSSLSQMMTSSFVQETLRSSMCKDYGLDFRIGAPYPLRPNKEGKDRIHYLASLLPKKYIIALCNVLAVMEKKVVLNISHAENISDTETLKEDSDYEAVLLPSTESTCTVNVPSTPTGNDRASQSVVGTGLSDGATIRDNESSIIHQISPTRTLKDDDQKEFLKSQDEKVVIETAMKTEDPIKSTPLPFSNQTTVDTEHNGTVVNDTMESPTPPIDDESVAANVTKEQDVVAGQPEVFQDPTKITAPVQDMSLDSLLSELKEVAFESSDTTQSTPVPVGSSEAGRSVGDGSSSTPNQQQKETLFVRLSNRIKALERNVSLSTQYLEELSRRYKRQVEEMQRAFNKTLATIGEADKKSQEREQKRADEVTELKQQVAVLANFLLEIQQERESWSHKAGVVGQHIVLIIIEVFVCMVILHFCRSSMKQPADVATKAAKQQNKPTGQKRALKRRKSVEGVSGHQSPKARKRRPSEEALNISGTYRDLLIADPVIPAPAFTPSDKDDGNWIVPKAENKKRRKKKKEVRRSSSSLILASPKLSVPSPTNYVDNVKNEYTHRRASSSDVESWWVKDRSQWESNEEQNGWTWHGAPSCGFPLKSHLEEVPIISASESMQQIFEPPKQLAVGYCVSPSAIAVRKKLDLSEPSIAVRVQSESNGAIPGFNKPKSKRTSSPLVSMAKGKSPSNCSSPPTKLKSDNWEWYSRHPKRDSREPSVEKSSQLSAQSGNSLLTPRQENGHVERRTSASSETTGLNGGQGERKNEKRGSSLKKIVHKFF